MTPETWFLVIAAVLVVVGLAGTILPAVPGVPLVFAGMLLAAWSQDFREISVLTCVVLGVLAALAMLVDFVASALGTKAAGASRWAFVGAAVGAVAGLAFGFVGLLFGPFVGAVAGELLGGGTLGRATKAGLGAWIGLVFGTLAKLAMAFTMLGVFALAWLV